MMIDKDKLLGRCYLFQSALFRLRHHRCSDQDHHRRPQQAHRLLYQIALIQKTPLSLNV